MPTVTIEVIEPGTDAYRYGNRIVQVFEGAAFAQTVERFTKDVERAAHGHDDDRATGTFWVTDEGELRAVIVRSARSVWDDNDYSHVSAAVVDAQNGAVYAKIAYRIDGRS